MAQPEDQSANPAPPPEPEPETEPARQNSALQWGVAVACTVFFWALVSVASRVSPAIFPALIRSSSAQVRSASFTLVAPETDRLILLLCSVSILAVLELRIQEPGYLRRTILMLPALLIASIALSPAVLLTLGALGMVAGIVYLVLHSSELLGVPPGRMLSSILVLLTASTAVVFSTSAARWALNALDGLSPLKGWTWSSSVLGLKLLNVGYWSMPELFLLLFFSWVVRLFLEAYWGGLKERFAGLSLRFAPSGGGTDLLSSGRLPILLVVASLAGSLFVGSYPYLHEINPHSTLVGYDVYTLYNSALKTMLGQSPLGAAAYAFKNDRTVFLLLQYFLALLTGSAGLAVRIVPALLALLLTVSTYFFVRAGVKDRLLAATAALFAAFSFEAVSAINAGLDADSLAMSEALVFFSLLLLGLDRKDRRYLLLSVAASVLILFTHPWVWLATLGVVAAYWLLTAARAFAAHDREDLRFELVSLAWILVVNLTADVSKQLLGGSSGVQDVSGSIAGSMTLANVPSVLSNLAPTLRFFLGGALDNSLLVLLATLGVLTIPDLRGRMNRLLLSWMAVASGGILLYGYSPNFLQARVILIAPLQVLAAMGLLSLLRYLTGLMSAGQENKRWVRAFVALVYISVFGAMLGYALQNVGFVYTGL